MELPQPDAALIAAYEQFRQLCAKGYGIDYPDEVHEAIDKALDAPDAVLFSTAPTTPHGVEVLLRRAANLGGVDRWFDRAIAYGDDETIRERLEELPGDVKLLAVCILSLTAARHAAEVAA